MKIAFLILAHNEPLLLSRLCNRLCNVGDVYVHLDKKADENEFKLNHDVCIIPERISVSWGGWSMIDATLALIKHSRYEKKYQKYVLLSGQDYPIVSDQILESKILSDCSGYRAVDIIKNYNGLEYHDHIKKYYFYDSANYTYKFGNTITRIVRRIINGIMNQFHKKIDKEKYVYLHSSQWWNLDSESIDYILNNHTKGKYLYDLYKYSFAPDEHYFSTLIFNSELEGKIKIINTKKIGNVSKANLHIIDNNLKRVFTLDDFEEIISSNKLFVRKVTLKSSLSLIDKLDSINES